MPLACRRIDASNRVSLAHPRDGGSGDEAGGDGGNVMLAPPVLAEDSSG
jgi:hypothetical protein